MQISSKGKSFSSSPKGSSISSANNLIAKSLYLKIYNLHQNKDIGNEYLYILNEELKSFTFVTILFFNEDDLDDDNFALFFVVDDDSDLFEFVNDDLSDFTLGAVLLSDNFEF